MTTKYQTAGRMPRSNALYSEYQTFLAQIQTTYDKQFGLSEDPQKIKHCKEISEKLVQLANNSHVNVPVVVIGSKTEILEPFTSASKILKEMEKFYQYFNTVHWNEEDLRSVEELTCIVILPVMHF